MPRKRKPPFLSPAVMRRAFQARLLSVDASAIRVLSVQVERLGGFEDRSFRLRYRLMLRLRSGQQRSIRLRGSCELDDETRRQSYVIMKYLWRHGFHSGAYQVARPVTFFYRWRLLVYEEASGTPLDRYLRRGSARHTVIEQSARWLVALHHHSPRTLKTAHSRANRKLYWQKALKILSRAVGSDKQRLVRAVKKTMAFEDRLAAHRGRVLVHHDFHPGNILISRNTVRVVDFTESRLSDPLVDVATFVAQLDLQLFDIPSAHVRGWQKIFVDTYAKHAKHVSLTNRRAQKIFSFMRYRIALQSYIGEYLLGNPNPRNQQVILDAKW